MKKAFLQGTKKLCHMVWGEKNEPARGPLVIPVPGVTGIHLFIVHTTF